MSTRLKLDTVAFTLTAKNQITIFIYFTGTEIEISLDSVLFEYK